MADATYTLEATGSAKGEKDMQRAERAMNKTRGASMKGGMAILDFHRGFKDFAVAGMRGAMNNIPTVMTNLGVGAGLTGVLAMVTVAVWKGVDALDAYLSRMKEMQLNNFTAGGRMVLDPDSLGATFNEEAVKRAEKMSEVMQAMAVANDMLSHQAGLADKEQAAERELANAKEMISLTIKGATEEEKRIALMHQAVAAEQATADAAKNTVKARKESLEKLEAAKRKQEETMDIVDGGKIDRIQAKMDEIFTRESKKFEELGRDPGKIGQMAVEASILGTEGMMKEAFGGMEGYENAVKEREVARENLKIIEKQIAAETLLLSKETASRDTAEKIAKLKESQLWAREQLTAMEEKAAEAQKAREAEMSAMMKERAPDVSNMLSSQGRSGLAGNEIRAAMDTLNIARQSLTTLKQIARNTLKRSATYA